MEITKASSAVHTAEMMLSGHFAAAVAAPEGRKGDEVEAVVNHGRWIASCPDCNGAQIVTPDDPRFWCVDLGHASKVQWRPVRFPPPKRRAAIEAELLRRPEASQRNWNPGETVKYLAAELAAFESREA